MSNHRSLELFQYFNSDFKILIWTQHRLVFILKLVLDMEFKYSSTYDLYIYLRSLPMIKICDPQ